MDNTVEWRPGPPLPTVCRCCLAEGCYKDISTEYFWNGRTEVYSEMLSSTFDIKISYSQSGVPNSNSRLICEACIARLRDATEFKKQVVECEKTFMQHLDPGRSAVEVEIAPELDEKEVKLEQVKEERALEDFNDIADFPDADIDLDDDDDLDDQPLTKLASKLPKKETVDILDLIDNKAATKRKATIKLKATSSKKVKTKDKEKSKHLKASASKDVIKPQKKKKENECVIARDNAELVVLYSTAYPFRLPDDKMVCVYCAESYTDPSQYRAHMAQEHRMFKLKLAFMHCREGFIKVDITDLSCRLCGAVFEDLNGIAHHLRFNHGKHINLDYEIGLQPFRITKNLLACAICGKKSHSLRQLSRHTQSHFVKYTCHSCGKSYSTSTGLRHHFLYSHVGQDKICRRCRKTFPSIEDKREHMMKSPRCCQHVCKICGQRFMSWNLKQHHLNEAHGVPQKSFDCPECGQKFKDRKRYHSHFRIAHTDDNFVCLFCGIKFDSQRNLDEHKVTHTKERAYQCDVCSKCFPRKKNLTQHMWMHSEYKRFECKPCNKKFNQRISWKTHMKSYHPELVDFDTGTNNNVKLPTFSVRSYNNKTNKD